MRREVVLSTGKKYVRSTVDLVSREMRYMLMILYQVPLCLLNDILRLPLRTVAFITQTAITMSLSSSNWKRMH